MQQGSCVLRRTTRTTDRRLLANASVLTIALAIADMSHEDKVRACAGLVRCLGVLCADLMRAKTCLEVRAEDDVKVFLQMQPKARCHQRTMLSQGRGERVAAKGEPESVSHMQVLRRMPVIAYNNKIIQLQAHLDGKETEKSRRIAACRQGKLDKWRGIGYLDIFAVK